MPSPTKAAKQESVQRFEYVKYISPYMVVDGEAPHVDYMHLLGIVFSVIGLLGKIKYFAWLSLYCSIISFANSKTHGDTKQNYSGLMFSFMSVGMFYYQQYVQMQTAQT